MSSAAETPLAELVDRAIADMATGRWSMLLREEGDFGASQHRTAAVVQEIARRAYLSTVLPAEIAGAVEGLRNLAAQIDPLLVGGKDAVLLLEAATLIERLATSQAETRRQALEEAANRADGVMEARAKGNEFADPGFAIRSLIDQPSTEGGMDV